MFAPDDPRKFLNRSVTLYGLGANTWATGEDSSQFSASPRILSYPPTRPPPKYRNLQTVARGKPVATPIGISTLQASPILVNQAASVGRMGKMARPLHHRSKVPAAARGGRVGYSPHPPRHPTRYILKRVKKKRTTSTTMHCSGAAASLEECIEILRRHWWPEQ